MSFRTALMQSKFSAAIKMNQAPGSLYVKADSSAGMFCYAGAVLISSESSVFVNFTR